jgi:hypothetical protein
MTARDQRTLRLGAIVIAVYLVIFFGARGWSSLEKRRAAYQEQLLGAQRLQQEIAAHENRVLLYQKLKTSLRLDPTTLARSTLVGDASAAIQKAAAGAGVALGPIRESSARSSARELASMQLEGIGAIPAVMGLFHRLETLGYPLIVDSVQITPDAKPGQVKVSLTIVILDYEQWKKEEPHA